MKLVAVLDEIDEQIIDLLCQGIRPKEIPGKIWKSEGCVRKRLYNLRKHYSCSSTLELVLKVKGLIKK